MEASPDGRSSFFARTVQCEADSFKIGLVSLDVDALLKHDIQRNVRLLNAG